MAPVAPAWWTSSAQLFRPMLDPTAPDLLGGLPGSAMGCSQRNWCFACAHIHTYKRQIAAGPLQRAKQRQPMQPWPTAFARARTSHRMLDSSCMHARHTCMHAPTMHVHMATFVGPRRAWPGRCTSAVGGHRPTTLAQRLPARGLPAASPPATDCAGRSAAGRRGAERQGRGHVAPGRPGPHPALPGPRQRG